MRLLGWFVKVAFDVDPVHARNVAPSIVPPPEREHIWLRVEKHLGGARLMASVAVDPIFLRMIFKEMVEINMQDISELRSPPAPRNKG